MTQKQRKSKAGMPVILNIRNKKNEEINIIDIVIAIDLQRR